MHALLRGDATHLTRWAQSLALPSDRVTFFNFLASHDGIGLNPRAAFCPREIDFLVERCQAHGGFISHKHTAAGSKIPYEMNIVYFDAVNDRRPRSRCRCRLTALVSETILLALRGCRASTSIRSSARATTARAALSAGINRRINRRS
jgi:sucrose phosphorylase